jgi:UDP-N-acetylmuramate dehydrogenase
MRFDRDVPLAPWTTLRLGGNAARVATVEREADVMDAFAEASASGGLAFVLGGGSNLVVADEGFDGLVVRMASRGKDVVVEGGIARVTLAAGEPWDAFVASAVDADHAGVECLAGIPGLVGATPIQNVGAYGQEVKDTVALVRAYDRETRTFVDLTPADCAFGYRTSRLKVTGRYVVTEVTFALPVRADSAPIRYPELARALGVREGETAPLALVRDTVVALRRSKGMVLDPSDPQSVSAGSFFMNPVVDAAGLARIDAGAATLGGTDGSTVPPRYPADEGHWKVPAAWLIERAGFTRGHGSGAMHVSTKHTLALVNGGGATTHDLLALAREIVRGVEAKFGVILAPEPVMLGCAM